MSSFLKGLLAFLSGSWTRLSGAVGLGPPSNEVRGGTDLDDAALDIVREAVAAGIVRVGGKTVAGPASLVIEVAPELYRRVHRHLDSFQGSLAEVAADHSRALGWDQPVTVTVVASPGADETGPMGIRCRVAFDPPAAPAGIGTLPRTEAKGLETTRATLDDMATTRDLRVHGSPRLRLCWTDARGSRSSALTKGVTFGRAEEGIAAQADIVACRGARTPGIACVSRRAMRLAPTPSGVELQNLSVNPVELWTGTARRPLLPGETIQVSEPTRLVWPDPPGGGKGFVLELTMEVPVRVACKAGVAS